ncbi:site-specific integrase [Bradyrhizobium sp. JYMT SZCCT0428]|uniref:site-specific integrase n=1 Tax=Bradyrhizobium sp. JYMT SZCCT0428 TaxID=2807673 RepID=UPI001BA48F00|nr:site-specific integrase [Bradyrhizobium sp. JYMT SZCCT0428]MBR1149853.1 site-specific integrase [Bradyrhizobium sp. JYMT SZCCT0428]
MSSTYHLFKREGVWNYRRRVPTALIPLIGKKTIQFSLGTTDLKEAKKRRALEDLKTAAQFEAAEEKHKVAAKGTGGLVIPAAGTPLTEREAVQHVQEYVRQMDARSRRQLTEDPPGSGSDQQKIEADVGYGLSILKNRDDPRADEWVYAAMTRILADAGRPVDEASLPHAALAELARRGLLELQQRRLARISDDHGRLFFDHLFDPNLPPPISFGELADQFLAVIEEDAGANQTSEKWVDKQRANVTLLREIIGNAVPIQNVDYDVCLKVRTVLSRLPANRSKLYKGSTISEAIDKGEKAGKPKLSSGTQEIYLTTLEGILDLAWKKRLIGANPAQGMKPVRREAMEASAKRRPFAAEQLKQFFGGTFYQTCALHSPPFGHDKTGWRFWLPLLCLFMGMRPNEACQMSVGDVKQTIKGTVYLDIVASSDEDDADLGAKPKKTVKTWSSKRKIPVHPQLISIGFLEFVAIRRKTGASVQLFGGLKPDGYGNHATYPLKRFREQYLPKSIQLEARQSFYSFRHNFRDALRRTSAPPDALQALGGWSQGKLVSDNYGDKSDPDYQIKYMQLVDFPGLDLHHLQWKG